MYNEGLKCIDNNIVKLPIIPPFASNNGHMFYLVCNSLKQRTDLIKFLKDNNIHAVFHYLSLHMSDFYINKYKDDNIYLPFSDHYTNNLVRLPLFYSLRNDEVLFIISKIKEFFGFN